MLLCLLLHCDSETTLTQVCFLITVAVVFETLRPRKKALRLSSLRATPLTPEQLFLGRQV